MGKPTGFLEYDRQANGKRAPLERIADFDEFRIMQSEEKRLAQAARCMNCGVPFCQSGETFGGMASGCPLHNLAPEWNDEIFHGNWHEALSRLLKTNNFPEFTGRVCPALCEAACTCNMHGDTFGGAVTVHDNELAIIEKAFEMGWMTPNPPAVRTGKRVAVIGSGPAGLAAADRLNRRGHSVTVFERDDRAGGLLMYGIPNMKLDKRIIKRRIDLMQAEGVEFCCNVNVGVDITYDSLRKEYDAVILCCGSKTPRDIKAPGRDAEGIHFAVDYLKCATEKVIGKTDKFAIDARDCDVIIVGGGDTGNDCVGTAIRQGAKSVTQLEMMDMPPVKRRPDNPWPQWGKVLKTDYGQEEAIAVFGSDPRIYKTTVKEFVKDENGKLSAVVTVSLEPKKDEQSGRVAMIPIEGSEKTLPCSLLLIAAGFVGCEDYVAEAFGVVKNPRGCLVTGDSQKPMPAEDTQYFTSVDGVFAAGDCRRGQSLVVHAISEGRACAAEVDLYLMEYSGMI